MQKKVLALHDLSGFGRSSLVPIIAAISAAGHQCVPLPTAYFSTHMAIPGWETVDLTGVMPRVIDQYDRLGLRFESVYAGFLGSADQIDCVRDAVLRLKSENGTAFIDPVMGDNGEVYATYTSEMCTRMRELCEIADIITPNTTEAAILLDRDPASAPQNETEAQEWLHALHSRYGAQVGSAVRFIGVPKTIDNDLCGTDHCPGFGSAAKYIGTTFAELERDCHVYTTKAVTIVEVMGRDAGWLTAASCLARANGAKGPDFIYLCEVPFSIDTFLKDVKAKLEEQDAVIIAVSEGVKNKDGRYISEEVQSSAVDSFGHSYIAGAAKVLEDAVRNEIGCKVRSIELNLMQRCAAHLASATDIQESRMLGKAACQYALEGAGGMMAAVIRTSDKPYATEFKALPVCDIANAIKSVPADYINNAGNDVTEKMVDYLTPLIQGEMNTVYENGIPKYIYLY